MAARRILVLGGGFAGLWSAIGAARKRQELGLSESELAITLLNRDRFHSLRVRNYEADLPPCRVPLAAVLKVLIVECHDRYLASEFFQGKVDEKKEPPEPQHFPPANPTPNVAAEV